MFKKPLIRYRIPRSNKKLEETRNSVSFFEAKKVGILYSSGSLEQHHAIKKFVSDLESTGKKVVVLTYLGKGKDNHEFLFNYFTKRDFNGWGKTENQHINDFVEQPFDFLYCLDFNLNLYIKYLLALSKSKCRIGAYSEENNPFYELMVKPSENSTVSLIHSMQHYTRSLN